MKRVIVWFRQDLRVHDNESLHNALRVADEVIPVYVFDSRQFQGHTSLFGFPKTGAFRARLIRESVEDLRNSLRKLGTELVVRHGLPEQEIFEIASQSGAAQVFCNRERTKEEVGVQDGLEQKLWTIGREIVYFRGKMLYYTQDLPFPVPHAPDQFTQFRKEVERIVSVREPLPVPEHILRFSALVDPGVIPTENQLGIPSIQPDSRIEFRHKGGESAALNRLQDFLWESGAIADYCHNRVSLTGHMRSSLFSPWLSQGCLSPKLVYHELKRFESERGTGESRSTYALFYELMYRDFLRLMVKKHGGQVFRKGGMKNDIRDNLTDEQYVFEQWKNGQTGVPFVDAAMRQLAATGYIPHQGRMTASGFLVRDLRVNWQMGAEYFESLLIDYDPCSNWVNWNNVAGLGLDSREDRSQNILAQSKKHDPDGSYTRLWVPELADLPADRIHCPEQLSEEEQNQYGFVSGRDYPEPLIPCKRWE